MCVSRVLGEYIHSHLCIREHLGVKSGDTVGVCERRVILELDMD